MEDTELDTARHIKYWQRCLNSIIPEQYMTFDSTRVALVYFMLSALDLLGAGPDTFPAPEREELRSWFLSCQAAGGGFCGGPTLIVGEGDVSCDDGPSDNHSEKKDIYDPECSARPWLDGPSILMTYFALLGLAFVGGLEDVRRDDCLKWLRTLQRDDGGFGEGVGWGARDMRCTYCGVVVRWLLGGGETEGEEDIDVERLVGYVTAGETYDGGFSHGGFNESHGGYTYCAIAALSLLGRLPSISGSINSNSTPPSGPSGITNINATIRWLVARQDVYIAIDGDSEYTDSSEDEREKEQEMREKLAGVYDRSKDKKTTLVSLKDIPSLVPQTLDECYYVGQNGRCNKPADTCYSFWNCGALSLLGQRKLVREASVRRFLLGQTGHKIGGFAKYPGGPPDMYHSFLGLAALATMQEKGLKELDTELCASTDLRRKIEIFKKNRSKNEDEGKK